MSWRDLGQGDVDRAFTVAEAMPAGVLAAAAQETRRCLRDELSLDAFVARMNRTLERD